jgi:hypothetical protein
LKPRRGSKELKRNKGEQRELKRNQEGAKRVEEERTGSKELKRNEREQRVEEEQR